MRGMMIVSGAMGLFFGLASYAVLLLSGETEPERWALIGGLAFFACILLYMMHDARRLQRGAAAGLSLLPTPATHQFMANWMNGRRIIACCLFLCGEELCLVELERKPVLTASYPCGELLRVNVLSPVEAEITLTQGRVLHLRAVDAEALQQACRERGWLIFQS